MDSEFDSKIILRYLAGECTPKEKRRVQDWIAASQNNREIFQSIKKLWSVAPQKELEADIDFAWEQLHERIEQRVNSLELNNSSPDRHISGSDHFRRKSFGWYKVAAIMALVILASVYITLSRMSYESGADLEMSNVVTQRGQKAQIVLDDGSRIRLNVDSKLTYPAVFGPNERYVYLSGEGYFEVSRDVRPFFVFADEAVIEILGTEFNVAAYEEEEIRIVVAGGKVSVRHSAMEDHSVLLERGDMASMNRNTPGAVVVTRNVNLERHLGWIENRLEFEAEPLGQVVRNLERLYEVEFHLSDDTLSELRLTAVFTNESIDEILEAIKYSLSIDYRIDNRNVFLSPQ